MTHTFFHAHCSKSERVVLFSCALHNKTEQQRNSFENLLLDREKPVQRLKGRLIRSQNRQSLMSSLFDYANLTRISKPDFILAHFRDRSQRKIHFVNKTLMGIFREIRYIFDQPNIAYSTKHFYFG